MPLAMLRGLSLSESGFGLDTQVTALLLRRGIRPFEVPVSYYSRSHDQGKKINWRDAVRCVWILVKTRISAGGSLYSRDALSEDSAPGDISSNSAQVHALIK